MSGHRRFPEHHTGTWALREQQPTNWVTGEPEGESYRSCECECPGCWSPDNEGCRCPDCTDPAHVGHAHDEQARDQSDA